MTREASIHIGDVLVLKGRPPCSCIRTTVSCPGNPAKHPACTRCGEFCMVGPKEAQLLASECRGPNPYLGSSMIGDERAAALEAFRTGAAVLAEPPRGFANLPGMGPRDWLGASIEGYEFWHAPSCGGASKLASPAPVRWES